VAQFRITRNDASPTLQIALSLLLLFAASASAQAPATAEAPPPSAPLPDRPFALRLLNFYRQDWKAIPSTDPAPARRGLPSPLDSPPFPNADWSYGGAPTLGEPDGNSYPLMTALKKSSSRTRVYGWVEPTFNLSTSSHSNAPTVDDAYANRFELNQAILYVERLPDTVQRTHRDFGFHLTALFGTDYRYTIDKGYFANQLLVHNHQYGFDPTIEYVDLYLPHVAGLPAATMNIRLGRFISVPGIEAQLTPNNYMFSHSLLYSIDPFTDTGVIATLQLNPQWIVQAGLTASHEVAPWTSDAKPSFTGCVSYTTASVNDNIYACANGINDGKYAFNNLQQFDATWYHRFAKSWHIATEAYLMYQRDVPSISGSIPTETGSNGAACHPGQPTCFAPEYAIVNYVNKQLSPHDFVSFRSDFLNDKKGQRTGTATRYSENTLMLSHWVGTTIQFRPEIRFDHAWDRKAYDDARTQNQFTFATDLIVHF
jgi:hypothetical protein